MAENRGFDTRAIHSGEKVFERSVTMPIFQTSTYIFEEEVQYTDVKYGRLTNTPNHQTLCEKIAILEGGEAGLVTSSGMSAISTALLAMVEGGGHLIAQDNLYGGTYYFLRDDFPSWGREVSLFSLENTDQLEKLIRPNTQALYVETISNPLLKIPDFEQILLIARKHNLLTIIDNTFASPYNFNPIALGFDLVLHSATKYLNGHSDVLAGAVVGTRENIEKIRTLLCHLGPCLDPHACFLLNRGIKTLGPRVRQQNESAHLLAQHLSELASIERVYYPGLRDHGDHLRAKKNFKGYGGMLSFDFRGVPEELEKCLKALKIPFVAPSLGGVETLVTRPSTTSHSGISPEERKQLGIKDTLVRVSVGLEDIQDLIEDFTRAFGP